jgi:hypothetical protein
MHPEQIYAEVPYLRSAAFIMVTVLQNVIIVLVAVLRYEYDIVKI